MDYMELALEEAKKAYDNGEVPVGTVIVKDNIVVAKAYNMKEKSNLSIAHAEILAIQKASYKLGDWRLNGSKMYVTLEPCAMCAAAIAQARISELYIGTFNKDMGSCGTVLNIFDYDMFNHKVNVYWSYDDRCSDMLTSFFKNKRQSKMLLKGERS